MNYPSRTADDPQVTAYALGELEGQERAAVEAALQADPALHREVEGIRAAAAIVESALKAELIGRSSAHGRSVSVASVGGGEAAPMPALGAGHYGAPTRQVRSVRGMVFRFPRFYYLAGGLAAACFAVVVALQRAEFDTRQEAKATLARIASARSAAEAPAQTSTIVSVALPPWTAGDAARGGPGQRSGRSPAAGFRGDAAGASVTARARPFVRAAEHPLSTFPVEVDPAGFAQIRRAIRQGTRPPAATVRIEEMLNYFSYRYPRPRGDALFAAALEVAAAPWYPAHRLVRIGLKGREAEDLPAPRPGEAPATLAKDVRIQVEFNPAKVGRYRLIGYDTRVGRNDDRTEESAETDDVGPGHSVTALYEIILVGAEEEPDEAARLNEPLRYQIPVDALNRWRVARVESGPGTANRELLTVTVRYRLPDESGGRWLEFSLEDAGATFDAASPDFRFAAAVAQYGMILRGSLYRGTGTLGDVLAWAAAALPDPADDPGGLRFDFLDLVRKTQGLTE